MADEQGRWDDDEDGRRDGDDERNERRDEERQDSEMEEKRKDLFLAALVRSFLFGCRALVTQKVAFW